MNSPTHMTANARFAGIDPSLYFVTDSAQCARAGRSVAATAAAAVAGGAGMVQVRDKHIDDDAFYALADAVFDAVQAVAAEANRYVPVFVNDRVAVAARLRAAGKPVHIHVGQDDTTAATARQQLGDAPLIGVSASEPAEFATARDSHAVDLVGVGPAFDTTTKTNAPAGLGVDALGARIARAGLPAVAIGGINRERAVQLRHCGAIGICVVSAICLSDDPQATAAAIHTAFTGRN